GVHLVKTATDRIVIEYGNGGAPGPSSRRSAAFSNLTLEPNTVYHLVGIVIGATNMQLFINVVEVPEPGYSGTGNAFAYRNNEFGFLGSSEQIETGAVHIDEFAI